MDMKNLLFTFIFAVALIFLACKSEAQTIGTATPVGGTNYFLVQNSGVAQTNQPFFNAAYKSVAIGAIASTNEVITGYYVCNPTNGLAPAPGLPGYYIIGSFSNSFASGTNGGTLATTFNGSGATVLTPLYLGFTLTGTNANGTPITNTIYVP